MSADSLERAMDLLNNHLNNFLSTVRAIMGKKIPGWENEIEKLKTEAITHLQGVEKTLNSSGHKTEAEEVKAILKSLTASNLADPISLKLLGSRILRLNWGHNEPSSDLQNIG